MRKLKARKNIYDVLKRAQCIKKEPLTKEIEVTVFANEELGITIQYVFRKVADPRIDGLKVCEGCSLTGSCKAHSQTIIRSLKEQKIVK